MLEGSWKRKLWFSHMDAVGPGLNIRDLPNALLGFFGVRTESELSFAVLLKEEPFEIRRLPPHTELCTLRAGTRKSATDQSFRDLFAYIKGANTKHKTYAMTVPVFVEKIASTWETSFFLEQDMQSVALPANQKLSLKKIDACTVAVVKFSGRAQLRSVEYFTQKLTQWIQQKKLKVKGHARLAQFDPPFAIPFLRRNELHIEVEFAQDLPQDSQSL